MMLIVARGERPAGTESLRYYRTHVRISSNPNSSSAGLLPSQVGVEQAGRLGLIARHEVPVEVERRRDARVPHVDAQRLGVDAGGDQERSERMPTLVQTDRPERGPLPGASGAVVDRLRRERQVGVAPEDEALVATG